MSDHALLEGRYALVTGSSRGIGRAMADALAGAGCSVLVTSRTGADCESAAREIGRLHGVQTLATPCDVSDPASVRRLFGELQRWSAGRLDVLVCNAGYPFRPEMWNTPLHATPAESLDDWYLSVFRTDAMGSVYCTYEALPMMMARESGSIIYVSSTPALEGFQGMPYTVAKAAILGLMKDVAREYGRCNIRANALALGNIRTPATFDNLPEESRQAFAEEAPLKRWGAPEEVGRTTLFLASDLSSFITGQTIVVDGGNVRW